MRGPFPLAVGLALAVGCGGAAPEAATPEGELEPGPAAAADDGEDLGDEPAREPEPSPGVSEVALQEILQRVIEDEELNKYLHLEQPGRFPLRIAGRDLPASLELTKGNEPVVVVAEPSETDAVLVFTEVDVGPEGGTLRFRYDVEGVRGTAIVEKGEFGWAVQRTRIVER